MLATLKLRLLPSKEQEEKFLQFSGATRWVYNWGLNLRKTHYDYHFESLSLQNLLEQLRDLKYTNEDLTWLKDIPESVSKQALKDLFKAYKNFYEGVSDYPKFKSKKNTRTTFYQRTDKIRYWEESSQVTITGVGRVRVKNRYKWFPDSPKNPRVHFDGKYWYLTVSYEVGLGDMQLTSRSIGIDLGIKKLAVRSDGVEVLNINKTRTIRRIEKRLKRLQRKVSRKYNYGIKIQGGENRYNKTRNTVKVEKQITLIHRRLRNIRDNHIHNATADIVKAKPYRVVVEDLNIKGMMKNRHLSKAIAHQCFYKFLTYLEYKCNYWGIQFIKANRFFPSSKLCSACGRKKDKLSLSERVYTCHNCNFSLDRDLNAAINLANYTV